MADLSYSDEALSVRGAFFGVKAIIYVEGDDDVLFWKEIFSKVTNDRIEIEPVGGAPVLDSYIKKIASGKLSAIVARDMDFLRVTGNCFDNPKVLYTFGYSIENSLYTPDVITKLVHLWSKSPRLLEAECLNWLEGIASGFGPLIHLDAANEISGSGVPTLGDKCDRYMDDKDIEIVCLKKVKSRARKVGRKISGDAKRLVVKKIGDRSDNIIMHMRGHFLASIVRRFIIAKAKENGKKVHISFESLYAAALSQFGAALCSGHPHKNYYLRLARLAWREL